MLAPSCGFYAEQRPVRSYTHDESRLDRGSLADAIRSAYEERPAPRADVGRRWEERRALAAAHREIYAGVLG